MISTLQFRKALGFEHCVSPGFMCHRINGDFLKHAEITHAFDFPAKMSQNPSHKYQSTGFLNNLGN